MSDGYKLCGRSVTTISRKGVKPRYLVAGMNHPKGEPIRYKSLDRAERDIINMKRVVLEESE